LIVAGAGENGLLPLVGPTVWLRLPPRSQAASARPMKAIATMMRMVVPPCPRRRIAAGRERCNARWRRRQSYDPHEGCENHGSVGAGGGCRESGLLGGCRLDPGLRRGTARAEHWPSSRGLGIRG